jgi:antitoxin PrlF
MHIHTTSSEVDVMKELLTVVTRKGQVTIPVEIRRALGLKEGDKVAFVLENDQVRLAPRGNIVARTAGFLKSDAPAKTPEEHREAAEVAIAEETTARMKG